MSGGTVRPIAEMVTSHPGHPLVLGMHLTMALPHEETGTEITVAVVAVALTWTMTNMRIASAR